MALAPIIATRRWDSKGEAIPGGQRLASNLVAVRSTDQEQWYAVQTRSRHEKVVAAQLQARGIQTYLPLVQELHRWSDRRKIIQVPLFPGYAFIRSAGSAEVTARVVCTDGVVSIVGARPSGTAVPAKEIEAIQKLLACQVRYLNQPFLKIGQRVRVRGGALEGVEGILLARKGETSLVISIEIIQRSLAVPIEGYEVQAA